MRAGRAVSTSHATFQDDTTGIPGLIEDPVAALVTLEGQSGVRTANNQVQAMLQRLVS